VEEVAWLAPVGEVPLGDADLARGDEAEVPSAVGSGRTGLIEGLREALGSFGARKR
jgi:hypothetical protein